MTNKKNSNFKIGDRVKISGTRFRGIVKFLENHEIHKECAYVLMDKQELMWCVPEKFIEKE